MASLTSSMECSPLLLFFFWNERKEVSKLAESYYSQIPFSVQSLCNLQSWPCSPSSFGDDTSQLAGSQPQQPNIEICKPVVGEGGKFFNICIFIFRNERVWVWRWKTSSDLAPHPDSISNPPNEFSPLKNIHRFDFIHTPTAGKWVHLALLAKRRSKLFLSRKRKEKGRKIWSRVWFPPLKSTFLSFFKLFLLRGSSSQRSRISIKRNIALSCCPCRTEQPNFFSRRKNS